MKLLLGFLEGATLPWRLHSIVFSEVSCRSWKAGICRSPHAFLAMPLSSAVWFVSLRHSWGLHVRCLLSPLQLFVLGNFKPTEKVKEKENEHLYMLYLDLPIVNMLPHCFILPVWAHAPSVYSCICVFCFAQPSESKLQRPWHFKYISMYLLGIRMFSYKATPLWPQEIFFFCLF